MPRIGVTGTNGTRKGRSASGSVFRIGGRKGVARIGPTSPKPIDRKLLRCPHVVDSDGREFRTRELIPEENRTGLNQLRRQPKRLRRAVAIAGRLVGSAHVRGCRPESDDRCGDLARWAAGAGLDAVIASAVRYAERNRQDHKTCSRSSESFSQ